MREWLKNFRDAAGMSQKNVAKTCGISRQYYNYIENGERGKELPVTMAKKIASALSFDWQRFYEQE